jgi:ATP-dependent 26S proteasome regulatory subunit
MSEPFRNGAKHLAAELAILDLKLRRRLEMLRVAGQIDGGDFRGLYISEERARATLSPQPEPSLPDLDAEISTQRDATDERVRTAHTLGFTLPLPQLAARFKLSRFEVDCIVLAIAPEVDGRYETLFAYVQDDVGKKRPTVELAIGLACNDLDQRAEALALLHESAPAFRHQLLRLVDDPHTAEPPLPARFLKVDRRIVDFALDADRVDGRIADAVRSVFPRAGLPAAAAGDDTYARIEELVRGTGSRPGLIKLVGPEQVGKSHVAESLCRSTGRALVVVQGRSLLRSEVALADSFRLLEREARLRGAWVHISQFDSLLADASTRWTAERGVGRLVESGLVVSLGCSISPTGFDLPTAAFELTVDVPLPSYAMRLDAWKSALGEYQCQHIDEGDLKRLASRLVLTPGGIRRAVRRARDGASIAGREDVTEEDLGDAARDESSSNLSRLAHRVSPTYSWDDIVLPHHTLRQLKEVFASMRYRHVVYSEWDFERKLALGKGLNVLFSGPSGTGKTMAAQILAHEMRLDIYAIDLASVLSKWIGELEQNLSRVFEEARAINAVLFFDEADALFGKRSEVKDSRDRYANIEVAYLLQRIDEYEGIVILATNLGNNIDPAFTRRMHHVVEFPTPDALDRERIWRSVFPQSAPLEAALDLGFLARQFDLVGGSIRNIALAAAFLAAADGGTISMEHLIRATAREYQKLGKLPSRTDFKDYFELVKAER